MNIAEPEPNILDLWRSLRAYIVETCALFGLPSSLAKKVWLSRAEHKLLVNWLRPLEAWLRRLLFIDALDLTPTPAICTSVESKRRARLGMGAAAGAHFHLDDSASWRVRFDLGLSRRHRAGKTSAPASPPLTDALPSAPLALRLEALIRAYNDREGMAQQLADRLAGDAAAEAALLAPPPPREASRPGYFELGQATKLARDAQSKARANDSS